MLYMNSGQNMTWQTFVIASNHNLMTVVFMDHNDFYLYMKCSEGEQETMIINWNS